MGRQKEWRPEFIAVKYSLLNFELPGNSFQDNILRFNPVQIAEWLGDLLKQGDARSQAELEDRLAVDRTALATEANSKSFRFDPVSSYNSLVTTEDQLRPFHEEVGGRLPKCRDLDDLKRMAFCGPSGGVARSIVRAVRFSVAVKRTLKMNLLSSDVFRFALDNTVDAIAITDIDSTILYVNPAFTTITGFTAEEAIGHKPSIQRSRHTTEQTYKEMWATILGGGWWRGEVINVKKSGEEWYSLLSISQVRDVHGKSFAYVGVARDITEIKALQFRLREASLEAIFMLGVAAEAKDEVTGSHIQRVRHYSESLALRLGLNAEYAEEIGYSSMMHDVGKIHIPDNILKKMGTLTDVEWTSMRQHPSHGVSILRDDQFYETAREIAGNHHERWDGTGYPHGRKAEQIPISARIVTVADVFDALTSSRLYKRAWTEEEAIAELLKQKGIAFDPDVVNAFVALYEGGIVKSIRERFLPSS